MLNKLKTAAAVATTILAGHIAKGQESVYDVVSEWANTRIITGTTANNGPTYLWSRDLNQLTSDNNGYIRIKRWWTTYAPTNLLPQTVPWWHTQVLWGITFSELDTDFSISMSANAFDENGWSTVPLSWWPFAYTTHAYDGEAPWASPTDNKVKTMWYETILTADFVNNLLEWDVVRIGNRNAYFSVTWGYADWGISLIFTKIGWQLVVTQDTGYTAVTLDTEEFNTLTPNYTLFPNPATAGWEVNISGITDTYAVEWYTYVVYDLMGRVVGEVKKGNGPITAPTTPWVYVVDILTVNGEKITKRIVVK